MMRNCQKCQRVGAKVFLTLLVLLENFSFIGTLS